MATEYRADRILAERKAFLMAPAKSSAFPAYRELVRGWRHVPNKFLEDMGKIVRDRGTETDPIADLKTYEGTWRILRVEQRPGRDKAGKDGQIVEFLRFLTAITAVADLSALDYIQRRDNLILNKFGFEEGEEDATLCIWKNLNPSSETYLQETVTDGDLETGFAHTGEKYLHRQFTIEEDKTATFKLWFVKDVWTNTSGDSPNKVIDDRVIYGYSGFEPDTVAWSNATWTAGQKVIHTLKQYVCLIGHSSTTFAADLAGGKWEIYGGNRTKRDGGTGIPISAVEEVRDNETPDTGHVIDNIQISESGKSQAKLVKTQSKANAAVDSIRSRIIPATGRQNASITRVFPGLTPEQAYLVMKDADDNSADMTSATYYAAPASHVLQSVSKNPRGGLYDVTRTTYIPRYSGGSASDDWDNYMDSYHYVVPEWRKGGNYGQQVRFFTYTVFVKQTKSRSDAYDFLLNDSKGGPETIPGGGNKNPVESFVRYKGQGRWYAFAKCASVSAYKDYEDDDVFADLGSAAAP